MLNTVVQKAFHSLPLRKYQSSNHLDFLRAIAALAVFVSHARPLFFADYHSISHTNILLKGFYFVTGLGHEAVIVFFVLSGFFISASVLKAKQNSRWSWAQYLISRLSRLYVVLIPALIIGGLWDILGVQIFGTGDDSLYGEKLLEERRMTFGITERLGLDRFLGHIFFLQGISVGEFGSNSPLWSLAYEFWYYILFPLLLLGCLGSNSFKKKALHLGLATLILIGVGEQIRLYFIVWLMGTAICLLSPRQIFNPLTICFSCIGLAVCLVISRFGLASVTLADFMIAIASFILIYVLLNDTNVSRNGSYESFSKGMAGFSYSLYVLHLPPLAFIRACLIQDARWQPDFLHLSLWLVVCAAVILYSYLFSLVTEAKTESIRQVIATWLATRQKQPR